jgi:hypothetical protein
MDDLVTWLRAQLDEDERVANTATSGPWKADVPMAKDGVFATSIQDWVADCDYHRMGPFAVHNAAHIARHDPARTLAEVAARRTIIDRTERSGNIKLAWVEYEVLAGVIRDLALPYVDQPGYREEWGPMTDRLHRADVAALLGIKPDSLQRAKLPPPDGRVIDGSHARPWWYRSTIEAWQAHRPGRGRPWPSSDRSLSS